MAEGSLGGKQWRASFSLTLPHHHGPLCSTLCTGTWHNHQKSLRLLHLFRLKKSSRMGWGNEAVKDTGEGVPLGLKILSSYSSYQQWLIVFNAGCSVVVSKCKPQSVAYHPGCFLTLKNISEFTHKENFTLLLYVQTSITWYKQKVTLKINTVTLKIKTSASALPVTTWHTSNGTCITPWEAWSGMLLNIFSFP